MPLFARGLVAAIANYLAVKDCNISDSSQPVRRQGNTGGFFMRVSFESEAAYLATLSDGFADAARPLHAMSHDDGGKDEGC